MQELFFLIGKWLDVKYKKYVQTLSGVLMYSSIWAPFFVGLINGPSKWTPRTVAPCLPPWHFLIFGNIFLYISASDVTIVGQNEVTPWAKRFLATFAIPSSILSASYEKSTPHPPKNK